MSEWDKPGNAARDTSETNPIDLAMEFDRRYKEKEDAGAVAPDVDAIVNEMDMQGLLTNARDKMLVRSHAINISKPRGKR